MSQLYNAEEYEKAIIAGLKDPFGRKSKEADTDRIAVQAEEAHDVPRNKLLSCRCRGNRSTWIYLFGITIPGGVRYAVRYYDTHDAEPFVVHYYDRHTVDRDCETFLSGGRFCRSV